MMRDSRNTHVIVLPELLELCALYMIIETSRARQNHLVEAKHKSISSACSRKLGVMRPYSHKYLNVK